MNIIKKIVAKAKDNVNCENVTIAFLGDSVTQGCFEIYKKGETIIETVFDKNYAYHTYLSKIFSELYPSVPLNIINAGISGDNARHGLERIERDVLRYHPDLTVVCFGLNDVVDGGIEKLDDYLQALRSIFHILKEREIEIIFMTPNMMNTEISVDIQDAYIREIAEKTQAIQIQGLLDTYINAAKNICLEYDVPVCDCYAKWKLLELNGVAVTELLSNKINHPTRRMNWLFAISLLETMMQN